MRILFMFDGLGRGGRERRFVQLVKGLNEAGYKDLYLINTRDIIEYKEILDYDIDGFRKWQAEDAEEIKKRKENEQLPH